jgi:hypothetical protein
MSEMQLLVVFAELVNAFPDYSQQIYPVGQFAHPLHDESNRHNSAAIYASNKQGDTSDSTGLTSS